MKIQLKLKYYFHPYLIINFRDVIEIWSALALFSKYKDKQIRIEIQSLKME